MSRVFEGHPDLPRKLATWREGVKRAADVLSRDRWDVFWPIFCDAMDGEQLERLVRGASIADVLNIDAYEVSRIERLSDSDAMAELAVLVGIPVEQLPPP